MKRFFYELASKFLLFFGDIKIFRFPFWIVYDPDDYQITGKNVKDIIDIIQPGDIILRGYNRYLDGKFIPSFPNNKIGKGFSHGAIYIGDFQIIHAVGEGVSQISMFDFLQCDRIAIFRPRSGQTKAIKIAKKFLKENVPYDFAFQRNASALYCFELCAECYPNLKFPTKTVSKLFGLIRKHDVYVAQSFIESTDVELVYCNNKNSNIEFIKN